MASAALARRCSTLARPAALVLRLPALACDRAGAEFGPRWRGAALARKAVALAWGRRQRDASGALAWSGAIAAAARAAAT